MEVSGLSRPLSVWLSHHVRPPEKTMDREHVGVHYSCPWRFARVGGNAKFAGSLGTQVVKVFQLEIMRTGLQEEQPRNAGSDPRTDHSAFLDSKAHYPGAQEIVFRICGDKGIGGLLGAQLIGH